MTLIKIGSAVFLSTLRKNRNNNREARQFYIIWWHSTYWLQRCKYCHTRIDFKGLFKKEGISSTTPVWCKTLLFNHQCKLVQSPSRNENKEIPSSKSFLWIKRDLGNLTATTTATTYCLNGDYIQNTQHATHWVILKWLQAGEEIQ